MAQEKSDLKVSSHEIKYFGDEELLKEIADNDRKKTFSTFGRIENLCHQYIYQIGNVTVNEDEYLVLGLTSSFGQSCRGASKIVFVRDKEVFGFYRNDITYPKKIEDNRIICEYESGLKYVIDLKDGLPDRLIFEGQASIPFTKSEND